MSQDPRLHLSVCLDWPRHEFPPFLALVKTCLVFSLVPVPQVAEHADHPLQDDHWQSTRKMITHVLVKLFSINLKTITQFFLDLPGQGWLLHSAILIGSPSQSLPPFRDSNCLFLWCTSVPPPHCFVQLWNLVQPDHWQSIGGAEGKIQEWN